MVALLARYTPLPRCPAMTSRFSEAQTTVRVARLSRKQEGVLRLSDTQVAGLTPRQVERLVASGAWTRPYVGVYIDEAVPKTALQPIVAASFRLGPAALASHRLCAWLWGLLPGRHPSAIEFCVSATRAPQLAGVRIYRLSQMPQRSRVGIIPVTTPLRAALDVGSVAPDLLPELLTNGFTSGLITPKGVRAELERAATQGKPGINALRAALKELGIGRYTPSELERRARQLFRRIALPDPHAEVVYGDEGDYRLDFYWPEAELAIEVDGWSFHANPAARRRDNRKSNRIIMGNHWLLRYDWADIVKDSARTEAEILEAYRARTSLLPS